MSNILRQQLEARQSVHTEHPGTDLLAAFIERRLRETERQKLLAHLATCAACREAVVLAVPEASTEAGSAAARGFTLHFPAAMRWASVAAALAVAVGVGVLYEHQPDMNKAAVTPSPAIAAQALAPAKSESATAIQDQLNTQTQKSKIAEHRKPVPLNTPANRGLVALDRAGSSGRSNPNELEASNRALSANVRQQPLSASAGQNRPQLQSVEGRLNGSSPEQYGATSQDQAAPAPPAPAVASASPAAPVGSVERFQEGNLDVAAEAKSAPASPGQTVEVAEGTGSARGAALAMPAKAVGFTALGGTMMKKSGSALTEIVSWSVTAAGKLQRQLRNGAVKLIEPAPGVVIRAVAARGIEVWAGGAQHDLSAKQWQQRPALFHSSDAGETWTKVDGPWQGSINAVTLTSPGSLTVATQDGTWVSRDAGKSWTTE